MKFKELQAKSKDDLVKLLQESQMDLIKENAQVANGTIPKNPGKISVLKKTIGKIKKLQSAQS